MKDNLPAKLLRIRTFGKMKLEEFKDLLSPIDYKTCENKMMNGPTWYPLTLDVFVKFLYKVICFLPFLISPSSMVMLVSYFIFSCFRGRSPTRQIPLQGCIVSRLPRLSGLLLRSGML